MQNTVSSDYVRILVMSGRRLWIGRISYGVLLLSSAYPTLASSQVRPHATVIRGHVRGTDQAPVVGADVTAIAAPNGIADSTRTDSLGAYSLRLASSAPIQTLSVRALGYATARRDVNTSGREVVADFQMSPVALSLSEVAIRAKRPLAAHDDIGRQASPGAVRSFVDVTNGLSGNTNGDITAALAMVAGVLPSPDGSGGLGPSAFGLGAGQNGATLNGMDGGTTIPRDGPTRIVSLSAYDPRLGRFSGLQVSTTVPSGTDFRFRKLHATVDDPLLQWPTTGTRGLTTQYQNQILSGTLSGPIVAGKTYYNTAFQLDRDTRDLTMLNTADANVLDALGIASDSVARLLSIAKAVGLPIAARRPASSMTTTGVSAVARIDLTPGAGPFITGDPLPEAYIMASGGARTSIGNGVGLTALPSRATRSRHREGFLLFDYAPYLFRALNDTKVSLSIQDDQSHGDLLLPSASLLLDSRLKNGATSVAPVGLGGNSDVENVRRWQVEATNDASWMTFDRAHTFDLYAEAELQHLDRAASTNSSGNFGFSSLTDFAAGRASSFTRQLAGIKSSGSTWRGAIALSDTYVAGPLAHSEIPGARENGEGVMLQYGMRADFERFNQRPSYNPLVDTLFDRRNNHVPNAIGLSPMAGFTWNRGFFTWADGAGTGSETRDRFSGGIREYRGTVSSDEIDNVARNTGLQGAIQQMECIGAATPLADWRAYTESVAAIPTQCDSGAAPSPLVQEVPSVLLYGPQFTSTRSWRGELQWRRTVARRIHTTLGATYALNLGGIEPYDLNFNPSRSFVLVGEENRPVFVPAAAIAAVSGAVTANGSRLSPELSHVTELRSQLRSVQRQATIGLDYSNVVYDVGDPPPFQWSLKAYYTYAQGRTQGSGFSSTTGGDPRRILWAPAVVPRHTIKLLFSGKIDGWMSISTFGQLYSGFPYTPVVMGDVNGDGYYNDQAFVFDPRSVDDASVRDGMAALIADGPSRARKCLRDQIGKIAARGSCIGPWSATLNTIAINMDPYRVGLGNRGALSIFINNPLGAVDRLIHGGAGGRGWGQPTLPDSRLLTVRAFDPAAHRFLYTVNPYFGTPSSVVQNPFRVTLDVHIDIGPNRETEAITVTMRRAREASGGAAEARDIKRDLLGLSRLYGGDDFEPLIRLGDEIGLDSTQVDTIGSLLQRYSAVHDSIYDNLSRYLASKGNIYRDKTTRQYWHDAIAESIRKKYATALQIRSLLTPVQIAWMRTEGETPWIDYTPKWLERELRKDLNPH